MTLQRAIDLINNDIQIDVRFCSNEQVTETKEALELAIYALEKQIPKKPVEVKKIGISATMYHCVDLYNGLCPVCKEDNTNRLIAEKITCCVKCGQALDWSDTE